MYIVILYTVATIDNTIAFIIWWQFTNLDPAVRWKDRHTERKPPQVMTQLLCFY